MRDGSASLFEALRSSHLRVALFSSALISTLRSIILVVRKCHAIELFTTIVPDSRKNNDRDYWSWTFTTRQAWEKTLHRFYLARFDIILNSVKCRKIRLVILQCESSSYSHNFNEISMKKDTLKICNIESRGLFWIMEYVSRFNDDVHSLERW